MPRRCSSGRRSVSLPVSARTSHVLPWSLGPEEGQWRPRGRGETVFVEGKGGGGGGGAQAPGGRGGAGHAAGGGAAERFAAAEAHGVGARRERVPRGGLVGNVDQRARAE